MQLNGYVPPPDPPPGWVVRCACGWWSCDRAAGFQHRREHRFPVFFNDTIDESLNSTDTTDCPGAPLEDRES